MKVTVATSIKYGNYKQLQPAVNNVTQAIHKYWNELRKSFDFPQSIEIHIRPVKGSTHGRAFQNKAKIEIDPRYDLRRIVETIAHELTHCEQYKQERLIGRKWNGIVYQRATTHKQYLNLPWEIEARKRAKDFVDRVMPL